jgi:hypothetical protein
MPCSGRLLDQREEAWYSSLVHHGLTPEESATVFRSEATIGQQWSQKVANELNNCGVDCYATPLEFATSIEDRARFENEQDVIFTSQTGCIEVKSRRLKFTNDPTSYPYLTAFVDTVQGWDKKSPKPLAVVLVSQITSAKLVIPVSTQSQWGRVNAYDRVRHFRENWYTVNKTALTPFPQLVEWLLDRQINAQGKHQ